LYHPISPATRRLIELALDEDRVASDYTTLATVPDDARATGELVAREPLVLCGLDTARAVFAAVNPELRFQTAYTDGERLEGGTVFAEVQGCLRSILAAERTALNFLGRMCGVATVCRTWSGELRRAWEELPEGSRSPSPPRLVDTRKTLPGWRELDKYAVRVGGACNHRHDLASGILIKDNHLAAAGGVAQAVHAARARCPHGLVVEVEVTDLVQLDEALDAGAGIVLLDNMDDTTLATAVLRCRRAGALCEVSGGVDFENLPRLAALGPDLVSAGALTHSAPASDVALDVRPAGKPDTAEA
jgi:nicotinate-nucleotide pyrophosphorylase (carboxylating)